MSNKELQPTLEISEIIGRTERTVYKYLRLTKEQQEQLKQTIVSPIR
ncbi:hypothetical protein [Paenibacillus graminis]|nr:hypothetical protein [Paenibacillus graminis]